MAAKPRRPAVAATPPAQAGSPQGWGGALARHTRLAYALAAAAILIPCFWHGRLQAGDLSSHIYNAWLAQLIAAGQAPGLITVTQWTNVLFDLLLSALFQAAGAEAAQRVAVGVCVLVFASGAFAFVRVVSGRAAWEMAPVVAMLAYGWVFHMGFFNYYLSTGLCFWALAVAWEERPRGLATGAAVLAVAWTAHALPVLAATGILGYAMAARRPSARRWMPAVAAAGLAAIHVGLRWGLKAEWSASQAFNASGLDQVLVFDTKYWAALAGLAAAWGAAAWGLNWREAFGGEAWQVAALSALAVFLLPGKVLLPGYGNMLVFVAERLSLVVAVLVCAALARAQARPGRAQYAAAAVTALFFFGFLYRDEGVLNAFEERMERLVAQLPERQRVISAIDAAGMRVNAITHMIDRVCVGRCYSYANYEPASAQFRVRAVGENGIVKSTYEGCWQMQMGSYVVQPGELPLYEVNLDQNRRLVMLSLLAGVPNGITPWNPL